MTSQPTLHADALQEVHAFWMAGMSCDGCSIAAVGAPAPSAESLMLGNIPGVPKVVLHHPVLSPFAGEEFMEPFFLAREGKLNHPYVIIFEGSVADESLKKRMEVIGQGLA